MHSPLLMYLLETLSVAKTTRRIQLQTVQRIIVAGRCEELSVGVTVFIVVSKCLNTLFVHRLFTFFINLSNFTDLKFN